MLYLDVTSLSASYYHSTILADNIIMMFIEVRQAMMIGKKVKEVVRANGQARAMTSTLKKILQNIRTQKPNKDSYNRSVPVIN